MRLRPFRPASNGRTSARRPLTAAAATIAGDIRWVRAPGPCRPRKLRLVVEAQRSPGATRSPLMPTHIEQPDSPHSRPASRKMRSSPSSSAWRLTESRAGRDQARHLAGATGEHRRRGAQILDAGVGAGADEHAVDRDVGELPCRARGPCSRARRADIWRARRRLARRIGHAGVDRQRVLRAGAPGHDRRDAARRRE